MHRRILRFVFRRIHLMGTVSVTLLYTWLRFGRDRDRHYVLYKQHIGDIMLGIGFARSYQKQKGYKNLTVIACAGYTPLFQAYPGEYDEMVYLSYRWWKRMEQTFLTDFGFRVLKHLKRFEYIDANIYFKDLASFLIPLPGITLTDVFRSCIYHLPPDTKMVYPRYDFIPADHLEKKFGICLEKTIVLSPFSRSIGETDMNIFIPLGEHLRRSGYTVVINRSDSDPGLKFPFQELVCDLREAVSVFRHCKCLIGYRSGLMDCAVFSGCNIIAVYPDEEAGPLFHDLDAMWGYPYSGHLESYILIGENNEDICRLLQLLMKFEES